MASVYSQKNNFQENNIKNLMPFGRMGYIYILKTILGPNYYHRLDGLDAKIAGRFVSVSKRAETLKASDKKTYLMPVGQIHILKKILGAVHYRRLDRLNAKIAWGFHLNCGGDPSHPREGDRSR